MTYLDKLRALREDADMSQQKMAKALYIAQTSYARYERGEQILPLDVFVALCRYHGVSADELLDLQPKKK